MAGDRAEHVLLHPLETDRDLRDPRISANFVVGERGCRSCPACVSLTVMMLPTWISSVRVKRTRPLTCVLTAGIAALGCSADPGGADGPPVYQGNGLAGAPSNGMNASQPPGSSGAGVGSGSEQNPATAAPLSNGSTVGGANGSPSGSQGGSGGVGAPGAAGSPSGGAAGMTPPGTVEPPAPPPGASAAEIAAYFAALPCGAKYTALGDGGWRMCLRLQDGGGACASGSAAFTRVTLEGGGALTDVAQVSGFLDASIAVVTTGGALHVGRGDSVSATPLIPSGVVNFSGGYHAAVALVERGEGFGVLSWTDGGAPAEVVLPGGAQPIQVSANYGLACALTTTGEAYCWTAGGNHNLPLTDAPTRMTLAQPVKLISVGQNSVCGVSFNDTLECQVAFYDGPWLPTEGAAPNFLIRQSTFPAVREIHAGFRQGIVVRSDGAAFYLGENQPGSDNPGTPFTGASDVIAAGGDRGNACVHTRAGTVFCRVGTSISQATLGGAPLSAAASCPL